MFLVQYNKTIGTALFALAVFFSLCGCNYSQTFIDPHNPALHYQGRITTTDSTAVFYWPGTSVELYFTGSEISATVDDSPGENFYDVILDDSCISTRSPGKNKGVITLAKELKKGIHHLQFFKATEAKWGQTRFYGFSIKNGKAIDTNIVPKRKIEFYGNSITCGYAVNDISADRGSPEYEDNYVGYAAITARTLHADYRCIAKSGIGLMVSWFPIIMPEMYERLDPDDAVIKWDFSKWQPDIVVINLLQNDAFLYRLPNHAQFKARFGDHAPADTSIINAYKNFVRIVRTKYPDAYIICALGSMDAVKDGMPWKGYVTQAVNELKDPKITAFFFPFVNTNKHPKAADQKQMADLLTAYIKAHMKW